MTRVDETLKELERFNFAYFMDEMLNRVPADIDKREGAVIYDALAPSAYALAETAIHLRSILENAYTQTARGQFLDYKAQEKGMRREAASNAKLQASFISQYGGGFNPSIGDRFASVGAKPVYYTVTEKNGHGLAILTADTPGFEGNSYIGQILPLTPQNGLKTAAITELTAPAQNEEDDESLRARLLNSGDSIAFGGNVSDYIRKVNQIDGVGAVQVYPTWSGGGTVKLVIVDNTFNLPSSKLLRDVQEAIDPQDSPSSGYGIAPVGHRVTVVSPIQKAIAINATVQTDASHSLIDVEPAIRKAIEGYFTELRKTWAKLSNTGRGYSQVIYRNQIITKIMNVVGVVNVSRLTLNQAESDITLVFNNSKSELASLGTVVITNA